MDKTGKSLAQWIVIARQSNLEKHGQIVDYLKSEHGLTHGYSNFVAHKTKASDAGSQDDEDLITAQYTGKESLKPIYDKILGAVVRFGEDVEVAPKKGSVSLRRKKQFALVQPATKTRIDLGLKFKIKPNAGRLEGSGPFGTMCTHRVRLYGVGEVDAELLDWVREAYEGAG